MPNKPLKPCNYPMCPELTGDKYCAKHRKQNRRSHDRQRGTAAQRGYNYRWQKARELFLQQHPLCVECLKEGRPVPAVVVDHIQPHKGDDKLFWDRKNWQALCVRHHNRKTAREGGGLRHG